MEGRGTSYDLYGTSEKRSEFNPENVKLLKEFLEYCVSKGLSPETLKQYQNRIECFFVYLLEEKGNKSFIDVTKKDLILWQGSRMSLNKSSSNIRQSKSALSSMSNFIVDICDDQYPVFKNIIGKIPTPANEQKREKTYLSEIEINLIKNELIKREKWQLVVYLMLTYNSASRKSESWQAMKNIDLDSRETNVVKGKGKKSFSMPFSKETAQYIKIYLEKRGEDDCPFMFVIKHKNGDTNHISKGVINGWCTYMSSILKELTGRDVVMYPHMLKACRLSNLYHDSHLSVDIIQQFGRHSSPSVTLDHYIEKRQGNVNKSVFGEEEDIVEESKEEEK